MIGTLLGLALGIGLAASPSTTSGPSPSAGSCVLRLALIRGGGCFRLRRGVTAGRGPARATPLARSLFLLSALLGALSRRAFSPRGPPAASTATLAPGAGSVLGGGPGLRFGDLG